MPTTADAAAETPSSPLSCLKRRPKWIDQCRQRLGPAEWDASPSAAAAAAPPMVAAASSGAVGGAPPAPPAPPLDVVTAIQVQSRLTAAVPVDNPYCSCKLTRVRSVRSQEFPGEAAGDLPITVGDRIVVTERADDGWLTGYREADPAMAVRVAKHRHCHISAARTLSPLPSTGSALSHSRPSSAAAPPEVGGGCSG